MTAKTAQMMGALGASLWLLAAPALGQEPCEARPAAVYFEPGATTFNAESKAVIDRVAQEAKTCGAKRVVAEAPNGERGKAISDAFASQGVTVVLGNAPNAPKMISPDESMRDRSATLRVDARAGRVG